MNKGVEFAIAALKEAASVPEWAYREDVKTVLDALETALGHKPLRITGYRGNPLRVVLTDGREATITEKLVAAMNGFAGEAQKPHKSAKSDENATHPAAGFMCNQCGMRFMVSEPSPEMHKAMDSVQPGKGGAK